MDNVVGRRNKERPCTAIVDVHTFFAQPTGLSAFNGTSTYMTAWSPDYRYRIETVVTEQSVRNLFTTAETRPGENKIKTCPRDIREKFQIFL